MSMHFCNNITLQVCMSHACGCVLIQRNTKTNTLRHLCDNLRCEIYSLKISHLLSTRNTSTFDE